MFNKELKLIHYLILGILIIFTVTLNHVQAGLIPFAFFKIRQCAHSSTYWNTAGTYTFSVPAGCKTFTISGIGGGGGGGGASSLVPGQRGGNGVVILSYTAPQKWVGGSVSSVSSFIVHRFTANGTLIPV